MSDETQAPAPTGRRGRAGGGADARRAARTSTEIRQAGFIRRAIKPYEPFTDEQLELIERNAETVLQETGIDFYEDEEDRKSTRLNSSHLRLSRMPSSA